MDKIVTYYLGAGSSANSIPMVANIAAALQRVVLCLESAHDFRAKVITSEPLLDELFPGRPGSRDREWRLMLEYPDQYQALHDSFVKDLQWLGNEQVNHQSVDTYAKMLYLQKDWANFRKLKRTLTIAFMYFEFCQLLRPRAAILSDHMKIEYSNADLRYDSWFASLLRAGTGTTPVLPEAVRVISWNYDFQFERAFLSYMNDEDSLSSAEAYLRVRRGSFELPIDGFRIVKLNGTAIDVIKETEEHGLLSAAHGVVGRTSEKVVFLDSGSSWTGREAALKSMLDIYMHSIRAYGQIRDEDFSSPNLRFAWEENNAQSQDCINCAAQIAIETNILVVIGYSFPVFNRAVDQKVLSEMANLEKVVIQTLPDTVGRMKEALKAIRPDIGDGIPIEINTDCTQFHIPHELMI